MKILNLVDIDKSDIKYQVSKFPDGQQQIVILPTLWINDNLTITHVQIKSRLNNFLDLELIICATKSLKNLGIKDIHLYVPYFLGSRSDRQFEEGSNNYLKDIICPIINSLRFNSVTVLDPHSDVLEACLNGFKKVSNLALVKYGIRDIGYYEEDESEWLIENFVLVSPDAGASKKIYKIAEKIGYKGDIITCSKDRDESGKLTKCIVPLKQDENGNTPYNDKDFIIIDDICDGGATFINIAKEIRDKATFWRGKIYLIVTHGIFSKGFNELSKYFDGIYCTNSYSNTLKGSYYGYDSTDLVKQLNVF